MENEKSKKQTIFDDEKAFANQWEEVVSKYPLVAIRFLEIVHLISKEWPKKDKFSLASLQIIKPCDEDSPIRASSEFCDWLNRDPGPEPFHGSGKPDCRQARNEGDVERYVKCLSP